MNRKNYKNRWGVKAVMLLLLIMNMGTSSATVATAIADGTEVYIRYNAGTADAPMYFYLNGGQQYSCRAVMAEHGIPFTLVKQTGTATPTGTTVAIDKYKFQSAIVANGDELNANKWFCYNGGYKLNKNKGYWQLVAVDAEKNQYKLFHSENGKKYIKPNSECGKEVIGVDFANAQVWEIVTKEQLAEELNAANSDAPVDATFYITDPDFAAEYVASKKGLWKLSADGTTNPQSLKYYVEKPGSSVFQNTEIYANGDNSGSYIQLTASDESNRKKTNAELHVVSGGRCELRQVLTGLKNGFYRVSAYGVTDGQTDACYLFADNGATPLAAEAFPSGAAGDYIAAYDLFTGDSKADYQRYVDVLVTDGTLAIGFKSADNPTVESVSYVDYFELHYCGEDTRARYTITYDANGGTGAPEAQTKIEGEDLTLSSVVPTREGYKFVGWCALTDAGHDYVDLGLPSGLKWATCNIGATAPEEYGDYFAWGETTGYNSGKTTFDWSTYKYCNGSETTLTKYCNNSSYGTVDNITTLDLADDAARANWGGSWRMPTHDEFTELYNNCTTTWTTVGGVYGRLFTSKNNGNTLFLPAAGYRDGTSLSDAGTDGSYWSSSLNESYPYDARYLYFYSSDVRAYADYRVSGQSVRAVTAGAISTTYAAGATYSANADVTLYAQWELDPSQWSDITLANNSDNSEIIEAADGTLANVTLAGRTLWRDGDWNTLVLPFNVNRFTGTPLEGATVKTLESSTYSDGTLVMNFADVTAIEAGKPYIVKWTNTVDADLVIRSEADWNTFADNVDNYTSKVVKLAADISVTKKVNGTFKGTFDGGGHTLTFNYTTSANSCAPFGNIDGATIKNLRVAGTLKTSGQYAGGIAAFSYNNCTIENCHNSITLSATRNGDGTHGGFVGDSWSSTLTFRNCLFDGKLLGSKTTKCGGFVGYRKKGSIIYNSCLFAPTERTMGTSSSCTFNRNGGSTFTNAYYTQAFGSAQGTAVGAKSDAELVADLGSGWELKGDSVVPKMPRPIVNPMFPYIVISNTTANISTDMVDFIGSYDPMEDDALLLDAHNPDGDAMHAALRVSTPSAPKFHTFEGWYTDAERTKPVTTIPFDKDGNVTLYAKWEKAYIITYDANGGTGAPEAQQKGKNEESITLSTTIPTRPGYKFVEWRVLPDGGHDYVDLGLPSGLLWATCNVGANAPEEYGDYFAWGETVGYNSGKTTFDWSTYKYCKGDFDMQTKYCDDSSYGNNGYTDTLTTLDLADDAAHANWGSSWRMPTLAELEELVSNCTTTWTTINGVDGLLFTNKNNGNTLFLPAAGHRSGTSLDYAGSFGFYWSSSLYSDRPYRAWYLDFCSGNVSPGSYGSRYYGQSVRAVAASSTYAAGATYSGTGDVTLYAQWKKVYTITFDANGGTGAPDAQTKIEGEDLTLSSVVPTRPGYKFMGWQVLTETGHNYVDLGLPSGLLWATCNIGANNPEEYGDYFAWGETTSKNNYDWETYKYCNGSFLKYTKYNTSSSFGTVDNITTLELADDAAHANWGGNWRMPTHAELEELINNCTSTQTTVNGMKGRMFTSIINGNTLFLPEAGSVWQKRHVDKGYRGHYWSSSLSSSSPFGISLHFDLYDEPTVEYDYRFYGLSVRAVTDVTNINYTAGAIYSGTGDMTLYAKWEKVYTITYDANGGTGAPEAQQKGKNEESITLSTTEPTRPGYKFVGWCTAADGSSNTHEFVDLGLPSGLLWATCNVGANAPEEYGDYFAWGETVGYNSGKTTFDWITYKYCNGFYNRLTKYCDDSDYGNNDYTDTLTKLDLADDAAHANWGGNWRMPTHAEQEELVSNCTTTWTTVNGVYGRLFTSKNNGNTLFLPAAGYSYDTSLSHAGSDGYYCSSSLRSGSPNYAWVLHFNSDGVNPGFYGSRYAGQSVRAVTTISSYAAGAIYTANADVILYAQWEDIRSRYTITYDANGGTGAPDAQKKIEGEDLTLSSVVPTREGYRFIGWSTSADGTGDSYAAGATYTANADVTLYAQWELDPSQWSDITLANNSDNSDNIEAADGALANVTLAGRTLWRDGDWNTLVLPFEVDLTDEDGPLYGAIARTLTSASLTDNGHTLTLDFAKPVNKLEAGVPYIIKWEVPADAVLDDIVNPVFPYVTIDATDNTFCSDDRLVRFVGTYDLVTFDDENKDVLFLGSGNNLYYPDGKATTTIGACRAYFKLGNDDFVADAAQLRSIVMDFGEESETVTIENVRMTPKEEIWFTLDGRRANGDGRGFVVKTGSKRIVK